MIKTIRHEWEQLPGFKEYRCKRCGLRRHWDNATQKMVYSNLFRTWYYDVPKCILPNGQKYDKYAPTT
jgi:hypothetical protein